MNTASMGAIALAGAMLLLAARRTPRPVFVLAGVACAFAAWNAAELWVPLPSAFPVASRPHLAVAGGNAVCSAALMTSLPAAWAAALGRRSGQGRIAEYAGAVWLALLGMAALGSRATQVAPELLAVGPLAVLAASRAMRDSSVRRTLTLGASGALLLWLSPLPRPFGPIRAQSAPVWTGPDAPPAWPATGCVVAMRDTGPVARSVGPFDAARRMRPCPGGDGPSTVAFLVDERPWVEVDGSAALARLAGTRWLRGSGSIDLLVHRRRSLPGQGSLARAVHGLRMGLPWATGALPLRVIEPPRDDGTWARDSDVPSEPVRLVGGSPTLPTVRSAHEADAVAFDWTAVARRTLLFPPMEGWTVQDLVDLCVTGSERNFGCGLTAAPWALVTDPGFRRERAPASTRAPQ
jgi:hypothetical protein